MEGEKTKFEQFGVCREKPVKMLKWEGVEVLGGGAERGGGWRKCACEQMCVRFVPLPINPRSGARDSQTDVPSKKVHKMAMSCPAAISFYLSV